MSEDEGSKADSGSKTEESESSNDLKFLAVGVGIGLIMVLSFASNSADGKQAPTEQSINKNYVNESLSEIQSQLLGSDNTYTDLQKDEIWETRYSGKWIEATAYVHSVDENAFGELVVLAGHQAESGLSIGFSPYRISFKESERGDLLNVSPNERISFEGKVSDYGGITSSISISEARIVE